MNKQTNLFEDIEKLEQQIEKGFKGKITYIEESDSDTFFGDVALYENKKGYCVEVEVESEPDNIIFKQFYAIPKATGLNQSNIIKFKNRYGKYPELNMIVDVIISDDGFFKIK